MFFKRQKEEVPRHDTPVSAADLISLCNLDPASSGASEAAGGREKK